MTASQTPRAAGALSAALLLAVYVMTIAPGVTFWDSGEFIAAAHGLGLPHPPGTPLYVAAGRAWIVAVGRLIGSARAMNLLSALSTAAAGGLTAFLLAREIPGSGATVRAAPICGALCAGLMTSVWANATETEVYAISLLHVVIMLCCAARAADGHGGAGRWVICTAYLIALAPAVHLSALVGAPAAVLLASRRRDGQWSRSTVAMLGGTLLSAAGIGRMSAGLVALGIVLIAGSTLLGAPRRRALAVVGALAVAASALLILLVRARLDPALNQGNPSTLASLAYVVARRQYDVAPLLPRQAPVWLQAANVAQYADWQVALDAGAGIFTSPARVLSTLAFAALAVMGARALFRTAPRAAMTLGLLLLSGTVGVAAYLNLKAGASLGYGLVPDGTPHEARERDYFFVLGFWSWGCLAGVGAAALARRVGMRWVAIAPVAVLLLGNWKSADRGREPEGGAARQFGAALLLNTPANAVLFAAGDNDTYPLWYLQQVEGMRRDVLIVTVPLLPAPWYEREIARRTGWHWSLADQAPLARMPHEALAAAIARAARHADRPIAASPLLEARERGLVGGDWVLEGPVYRSYSPASSSDVSIPAARIDTAAARRWMAGRTPRGDSPSTAVDPVVTSMLKRLECPRLAQRWSGSPALRDSLEVTCNLR